MFCTAIALQGVLTCMLTEYTNSAYFHELINTNNFLLFCYNQQYLFFAFRLTQGQLG